MLEQKKEEYKAALAEQKRLESLIDDITTEKELAGSNSSEEQRARDSGYVYPDEIVIGYKD